MRRACIGLVACSLAACTTRSVAPTPIRHPGATGVTLPPNSPAWVVDHFYAWTDFPDLDEHITGEFERRFDRVKSLGATLKSSVTVAAPREVLRTPTRAIYATALKNQGRTSEWYTYLQREDTVWKIAAVRTLEFKPVYYTLLDTLKSGWRLRDASPAMRKSMALAVASDSAIRAFFLAHQDGFATLITTFRTHPVLKGVDLGDLAATRARHGEPIPSDAGAPIRSQLEHLAMSSIFRDDAFPNCTFVRISGMGRAHAGYLYAPQGCAVPPMNPKSFIYVAPLRNNWYAYKVL